MEKTCISLIFSNIMTLPRTKARGRNECYIETNYRTLVSLYVLKLR